MLVAVLLTACAAYVMPPIPQMPRMPTLEEMLQAQEQRSGKAPVSEAAPAAGGVQVVFQTGHAGIINSVAMSADGRYILSASWDETAKLWDAASGQELRTITGVGLGGGRVAFVRDADRIVVGSYDGHRLIDLNTGRTLRELGSLDSGMNGGAAISADGRFAVTRDLPKSGERSVGSSTLLVVDLASDQTVATFSMDGQATPVALGNDGKTVVVRRLATARVLSANVTWHTELWHIPSKKLVTRFALEEGSGDGLAQVLSPDGRFFATSGLGKVRVFSATNGELQLELPTGNALSVGSLAFSPDGSRLASYEMSDDETRPGVQVWEIPGGRSVSRFNASAVNFSADGRTLVVGRRTGGAPFLRDLRTGKESAVATSSSAIVDLAVTGHGDDDSDGVAAATELGGVRHWDLKTGQLLHTFDCPGGTGTRSVSATPSRPWIASACHDGGVYLWSLQTGQLVRTLNPATPGKYGLLATVRFDPTGRLVAFAINEQLAVWDVIEGRELRRTSLPRVVSPFAQMQQAAMESTDGVPEETRRQLAQMSDSAQELQHAVRALAFHPDGQHIAVAKDNGALLVNVQSGAVVRRFERTVQDVVAAKQASQTAVQETALKQMFGGRGLSRKQREALESAMRNGALQAGTMRGGASDLEDLLDSADMVRSLAFSPDGRQLFTLGMRGQRMWDVQTGRPIERPRPPMNPNGGPFAMPDLLDMPISPGMSNGVAVAPDGRTAARGHGNLVKLWDIASDREISDLAGHTSDVTAVAYAANARLLVSGSRDGTLRIWSAPSHTELAQLIALGATDYVAVTPDQYYRASKRRIGGVAFRVNDHVYPFEQFDLRFNRPDIVLERLGGAPPDVVQSYRAAWQRRVRKLGLSESALSGALQLPEVALVGAAVPVTTEAASLSLRVRASDASSPLDRINVFVNDVPVYGTKGIAVPESQARTHEQEIQVPLVPGRNKVQVSVLNRQGAESLKQTVYTTSTADAGAPDIYVVAIGVSQYQRTSYNLRFAAKDASDLTAAYRNLAGRAYGQIHILDLTNEKATRDEIRKAKSWLTQARVNDLVVVFAAGHGMTDSRQDYYFGTHDIDPEHPERNGLPYEDFEGLLDGIPALKKVLLIDTCFSGEIEKDEIVAVARAPIGDAGTVRMRAFKAARGVAVVADDTATGTSTAAAIASDVVRFQQDLFADLRRGTGAVVISSASGNEYALEGEQWSNGVFTYALLNGLRNAHADTNQDQTITVSELQAYVIDEVRRLTAGGQNPTVRRENLEYDFAVF